MKDTVKEYLDQKKRRSSRRKKAAATLLSLSLVVAGGVTWSLHQTGESLAGETYCGKVEHTHTEACLKKTASEENKEAEKVLTCTLPEHTHTDACIQKTLICGMEEGEGAHTHTADCYQEQQVLTCTETEHVHGEDCYDSDGNLICEIPEHTHGEGCYTTEQVLVCGQEESAGHVHTDACYEITYTCGMEEHTHTDACYAEDGAAVTEDASAGGTAAGSSDTNSTGETAEPEYICGLEEHKHTLQCYSNPNADLESAAVWEQTIAGVQLTGDYGKDVVAIAKTQLGYHESTANYNVVKADDGTEKMKGYTRYGAWYGSPYEDWCAMFASFCISYAHVQTPDGTSYPLEAYCPTWIENLSYLGMYSARDAWTPAIGDLVFFDQNGDGTSDHVGIVEALTQGGNVLGKDADLTTADGIMTIEGNTSDQVAERSYSRSDGTIVGYGVLPVKEKQEEKDQTDGNITNPEVGLETEDTWKQSVASVTLTGDARADLVAVAATQIGYAESTENYKTNEDGSTSGYNRYGAWYGDPYSGWNATFIDFCLSYANVTYPQQTDAVQWAETLSASGLYTAKDAWTPAAGDLVFLDTNGDGTADRVGIVSGLEAGESDAEGNASEVSGIHTIEGDVSGAVAEQSYTIGDAGILGYGILTAADDAQEDTPLTKTAVSGDYTVTVTYDKSANIPANAELVVEEREVSSDLTELAKGLIGSKAGSTVSAESLAENTGSAAPAGTLEEAFAAEASAESEMAGTSEESGSTAEQNGPSVTPVFCLKIGFYVDGVEVEPAEGSTLNVQISVNGSLNVDEKATLNLVHFKQDGTAVNMGEIEKSGNEEEGTSFSFNTDSFSDFMVTADSTFAIMALDDTGVTITSLDKVEVTDDVKADGQFVLKITINGSTDEYTGAEAAKILVENGYEVQWSKGTTTYSNGLKVTTTNGEKDAVEENGGWIDVAYTNGSEATYTVTVTKDGENPQTGSGTVNYASSLKNGSFEDNTVTSYGNDKSAASNVSDWKTTATSQSIEILKGNNSVLTWFLAEYGKTGGNTSAADGDYWAELNADQASALYQDVLTVPGQEMNWQFSHRARTAGNRTPSTGDSDKMAMIIAPLELVEGITTQEQLVAFYNQLTNKNGDNTVTQDGKTYTVYCYDHSAKIGSSGNGRNSYLTSTWDTVKGTITVPDGQYTSRFFFMAVSSATGDTTIGNFVDNVWFSQDPTPAASGTGRITVNKVVEGLTESEAKTVLGKSGLITENGESVTLTSINGSDTTWTGTYVKEISNVTSGKSQSCTYSEDTNTAKVNGYDLKTEVQLGSSGDKENVTSKDVTITYTDNTKVLTFYNTYTPAKVDVTIVKDVTGDNVPQSADFPFTVSINGSFDTYQVTGGNETSAPEKGTDGKYTVTGTLSDKETIVLKGVTIGTKLTISESDATSYTTTATAQVGTSTPTTIDVTGDRTGGTHSLAEYTVGSGGATITVTNTYDPVPVDITIFKTSQTDTTVKLSGATFLLKNAAGKYYTGRDNDGKATWNTSEKEKALNIVTDANGNASINGLLDGTYTLEETVAPAGYNILTNTISIIVLKGQITSISGSGAEKDTPQKSKDGGYDYTVTVKDSTGVKLPMTGGSGTTLFTLSGLLLIAASLVYGCGLRRRRERRAK